MTEPISDPERPEQLHLVEPIGVMRMQVEIHDQDAGSSVVLFWLLLDTD